MKKIFIWSFGAFFRTLGRIFAYLSIGFLLAIICSKLGSNFGYIKVNAATVNQWADNLPVLNRVQMYECGANQCYDKSTDFGGIQTGTEGDRKYIFSSSKLTVDSSGGTVIQITTGDVLNKGYLYLTKFYVCVNPNISSYTYKIGNTDYSTPNKYNAEILALNDSALSTSPGITSLGYSSCRLYSGLYVPTSTGNNWVSIQFTSNNTQTTKFAIVAVVTESLGLYTNTIKAIVENSNGQVVDAVDAVKEETKKTNDTISDSDSSGATSDASGFFDSFTDNSHGLSGIITAPLNSINAMLSTTCTPLQATFMNTTVSLPCGYEFYSQIGEVNTWLNVIEGGFLCYLILRKLYLLIEKLKDPEEDKVEVMKL